MSAPCPWCHLDDGFHDEDLHDLIAMAVVPDHLRHPPSAKDKKALKAGKHRRNVVWLAEHGRKAS